MRNGAPSIHNAESISASKLPGRVVTYESTLRDGEQMPGVAYSHDQEGKGTGNCTPIDIVKRCRKVG